MKQRFYHSWNDVNKPKFIVPLTNILKHYADKSYSTKRFVGAVTFDFEANKYWGGYNNLDGIVYPEGYEQLKQMEITPEITNHFVTHAEEHSLNNSDKGYYSSWMDVNFHNNTGITEYFDREVIMFCTYSPCINCAKRIVNSGVNQLYLFNIHQKNFIEHQFINNKLVNISVEQYLLANGVEIHYITDCPLFTKPIYN